MHNVNVHDENIASIGVYARNMCAARHALMRICVAKNSDHMMHPEGVDTLRLVRNGDVCVRIIVGETRLM